MGSGDTCCVENSNMPFLDWTKKDERLNSSRVNSSIHEPVNFLGSAFANGNNFNYFSSSLPSLGYPRMEFPANGALPGNIKLNVEAVEEMHGPLDDDLVSQAIGDLLPDDEEFLAGITDGLDSISLNVGEDNEEFDLFSSLGGLELDGETQEGLGMYINGSRGLDGLCGAGAGLHGSSSNGSGSVIGEHPYGEHPSRTLFVRNINSNVEDSELRILFEHYGDIRTLYTACKHRGFVMISYYDIRAARTAMRALQNKPLRRRKLDIHFSIPKDNPSDKDVNQGTLVAFNLDASVSNDDLRHIFGQYGEVKEIRETPHKRHHKFIEFYDVRAAEAALRALNRSDIAGKRIKLEPSRPGGARRSLIQQLSQDLDQEDIRLYRQQSSPPVSNSPPGHLSSWGHFGSPGDSVSSRSLHHSLGTSVPNMSKPIVGFPLPMHPNPIHVGTIGSHLGRNSQIDAGLSSLQMSLGRKVIPAHYAQSLPEYSNNMMPFHNSPTIMPIRGTMNHTPSENEGLRLPRTSSADVSIFDHIPGGLGIPNTGSHRRANPGNSSLAGSNFLWGNSSPYQNTSPVMWSNPPQLGQSFSNGSHAQPQIIGYTGNHPQLVNNSSRLQVGSAPSGDPSLLERQIAYLQEARDSTLFGPGGALAMRLNSSLNIDSGSLGSSGLFESDSLPYRRNHLFPPNGMVMGSPSDMYSFDRVRIPRPETSVAQADNKKQYQLDIDRILRGEDNRTTLMIKNIPNKYTSKMLLAAIDEQHRGMYDFLYLPIDFKNKCNVGYAFINMTSPKHIIPIYKAFNGKKWEKFNSEKVASLAYARIQGKAALVAHFQNSSLMNEDKRCRPILFHSSGPEMSEQPSFLEIRDQISNIDSFNSISNNGNLESLMSGISLEKE